MALTHAETEVENEHVEAYPRFDQRNRDALYANAPRFRRTRPRRSDRARSRLAALRRVAVFDIPLAATTYDRVVEIVNRTLDDASSAPLTIDAINTMGLSESCIDDRMRASLGSYDVVVPDGMPVVWSMNAKGANLDDRVYGPYLTDRVLAGLERPTRVAVIGGFESVHEWLRRTGRERYPNADFSLLYDAPPGPIDEAYVGDCAERIEASGAELVFVCLGVPRQYYWTALAKERLRTKVCMSVGGAFDLISGEQRFAPPWMQRAGLTWLHRLAHEPKRLGPRYLKYNSAFIWFLLQREILGMISRSARAPGRL
jgi:N-acetylglucosaminyldiphosphoundecaprenol N-acetyl-beta-D-mannosaminyltransferase